MMTFAHASQTVEAGIGSVAPAISVEVRHKGESVWTKAAGWLDPDTCQAPTREDSLFDLASVTKLFVTTSFMTLVEQGRVAMDQPVSTILPEFCGSRLIQPYEDPLKWGEHVQPRNELGEAVDAGKVTFRNLLVHNSGLPAWRALKDQPDAAAARQLALTTTFFYPTGTRIVYSDIGLILLGLSIERITGLPLADAVRQRVTAPLGLNHTIYFPVADQPYDTRNIAPTEMCAWRHRRIVGEVHDENAARLGGVAGHAGLFSNAGELARFGQMYLDGGRPLLSADTVKEMSRLQMEDGATRRGLGFALWSSDPEASSNPFHPSAFGHTGFTGTSLWMDPDRQLVVAVLTNRVYYGRDAGEILRFRVDLHKAILKEIDSCAS